MRKCIKWIGETTIYLMEVIINIFLLLPVDAGMLDSANDIISVSENRFGKDSHPKAIILTHGHVERLSTDGSVSHFPEFCWIYTSGHLQDHDHVSFFRYRGKALIAGDALVTVK